MKKIFLLIITLVVFLILPLVALAFDEKNLPSERQEKPKLAQAKEETVTFHGYANSRDVTLVGGIMGCVYYFCKEAKKDFCSDTEGILMVSGSDTGKIPEMLKALDVALEKKNHISITLTKDPYFSGIRRILDISTSY